MSGDARCVGAPIADIDEVLSRVAHALKTKSGEPTRGAFLPSRSHFVPGTDDRGGLSTARAAQPPVDVYLQYVDGKAGRRASGVLGVTVGGFKAAGQAVGHDLPIHDDGGIGSNPEHHASVWYPLNEGATSSAEKRSHERIAKQVVPLAVVLYTPPTVDGYQ